ncbi:MAG: signal recognition particle-docking protein FtsY [Gemmataceae bacterium]|nr:signal recognition particle-docking protein FtsY [Gemmata sp.]MDW8199086.1 signal recognition particle-docking protein FtsY [Gemmataceae bacterium]
MLGRLIRGIRAGLSKTRSAFTGMIDLLRGKGKVDQAFLDELEKRLYLADVGTQATRTIVERVRQAFRDKEITGEVEAFVKRQLRELLSDASPGLKYQPHGPTVVMVAGVNGSGKTTSIAKLAKAIQSEGKKVAVAACDTFRAAAVEQLTVWANRLGCDIIKQGQGVQPAAVAHDACEAAKARGYDVLIVDTAGRLHTQTHLMKELEKIHTVVGRQIPGAPHEVLLVLDATTGQNAVAQAEQFTKSVKCTGIILTKLDGTAKGGAIFAIKQKLGLPVKFVGVGEKLEDLEPFDPDAFVEALFEKEGG